MRTARSPLAATLPLAHPAGRPGAAQTGSPALSFHWFGQCKGLTLALTVEGDIKDVCPAPPGTSPEPHSHTDRAAAAAALPTSLPAPLWLSWGSSTLAHSLVSSHLGSSPFVDSPPGLSLFLTESNLTVVSQNRSGCCHSLSLVRTGCKFLRPEERGLDLRAVPASAGAPTHTQDTPWSKGDPKGPAIRSMPLDLGKGFLFKFVVFFCLRWNRHAFSLGRFIMNVRENENQPPSCPQGARGQQSTS